MEQLDFWKLWNSYQIRSLIYFSIGIKISTDTNPGTLNTWLKSNGGYQGNLFVWGSVGKFGMNFKGFCNDKASMRNWINQGCDVMLNVNNGGHWVLAVGHDSSKFYVQDPGYSTVTSYPDSNVGTSGVYCYNK